MNCRLRPGEISSAISTPANCPTNCGKRLRETKGHMENSLLRFIKRPNMTPQTCFGALGNRRLRNGMVSRTTYPSAVNWASVYQRAVSYTHLRAHETDSYLVC